MIAKDSINKFLFFSSAKKKDYFVLSFDSKILARVFRVGSQWYVWYESCKYRMKVNSFTDAMRILEKEFTTQCTKYLNKKRKKL